MQRVLLYLGLLTTACATTHAQWDIQNSTTTADLRGIDNVGSGVAWASGTNGTVLRTEDGGYLWQACSIPPGAEHLDFRGIQAFDANTAIVMSSGKGDLSRLYKTTDGCHSWKLLFTNPDPDGFWDAILLNRFGTDGELLGDPVNGRFAFWETSDKGATWTRVGSHGLEASKDEGAFAASNTALDLDERNATWFVTGGPSGAQIFISKDPSQSFMAKSLPLHSGLPSAGAFSIHERDSCCLIVVGGDYLKPNDSAETAAYSLDGGATWHSAATPPHGYRSAVAYEQKTKTWVTVGPNGTDISTDDGRNWRALHPDATRQEPADVDKNWNALSLPFAVGPHGRIGKLNEHTLTR
jgi:photosystem II stability/assembly factor-like uncharacterized protein